MFHPRRILFLALAIVILLSVGCAGTKILVPPRVDLQSYRTIGMVNFTSNSEGSLDQFTSQRFVQTIQSAQPGVRVLELGDQERVLGEVDRDQLDFDAIQAIGERYNVDAVIVGEMEVTEVKPKVNLTSALTSLSMQADVEASLTARLFEAGSGATMWTNSARGKETVGHVGVSSGGPVRFGARDPEEAYGELVDGLVYRVTHDFRSHWRKQ